jgi:hypothetical protein
MVRDRTKDRAIKEAEGSSPRKRLSRAARFYKARLEKHERAAKIRLFDQFFGRVAQLDLGEMSPNTRGPYACDQSAKNASAMVRRAIAANAIELGEDARQARDLEFREAHAAAAAELALFRLNERRRRSARRRTALPLAPEVRALPPATVVARVSDVTRERQNVRRSGS